MDLLIKLQRVQDLLSEKTGLCLALYDHKLQEVTIPSGLPEICLQMTSQNNKCLDTILHKFEQARQQQTAVLIHCPHQRNAFAFQTGIEQAGQKLILIGGRIADQSKLKKNLELITAVYGLPLKIDANKKRAQTTAPKALEMRRHYNLTPQEINILILISKGFSNQDIASKLYISINTVKTHVTSILRKLEAGNRTEAALIAFDRGLIQNDGLR